MPIIFGQVGAPSNTSAGDGSNLPVLQGKQGDLGVSEVHGKYYTQNYRSKLFIGSTAAGGVIPPNYSSSAQTFGLWNQGINGQQAVIVSLDMNIVTLGTPAVSGLGMAVLVNAGTGIATGGISAFTSGSPYRGNLSGASGTGGNSVLFTPSSATVPTTSLGVQWLPFSYLSTTTATAGSYPMLHYDFDGSLIVPSNTALFVVANILTGSTWNITLKWYEAPQ